MRDVYVLLYVTKSKNALYQQDYMPLSTFQQEILGNPSIP